MQDNLFSNQSEWSDLNDSNAIFKKYAKELGLDTKKFEADLKNKNIKNKINSDTADGKSLGVNSTPTFFLNGQRMQNFGDIETIIKSEIK